MKLKAGLGASIIAVILVFMLYLSSAFPQDYAYASTADSSDKAVSTLMENNTTFDTSAGSVRLYFKGNLQSTSKCYYSCRKRLESKMQLDSNPPSGVYNSAKERCLNAVNVTNSNERYCVICYETFKGFSFIGIYQNFNTGATQKADFRMLSFITYFNTGD